MLEILTHIGAAFLQIQQPNVFAAMLLGIGIGFVVGILPGIGGPATLAILVPFTFGMDAFQAFALLMGMMTVTGTSGDITAVLFGIPGETPSAATVVDGHPMARNGEAGRALGAVLTASLVGGLFGAFCLALGIVLVRPLVLAIGYAEFFMLGLAGITFMASLTGGAVVKGLAAGALGLALSMIGLDPIGGTQRFTFGQLFLWDGIGLLPMVLGLYAIPELIDMARGNPTATEKAFSKLGGLRTGVHDTFRHIGLVLRCSAIGTYLGLIPGIGATVAAWVAYGHAAQTAKDPARFGKGAVEGVLAPGASNNATMCGALVPTIGFGVPATPGMAILLGALIVHGITPGPKMLTPESQGGYLTLTFFLVALIIAANVIAVVVSLLLLRQLARMATVRATLLIPFILLLIFIGSFAEKNAFPDLALTMIFGVLAWLMVELGWPRPPLILGVVLGPLIETNLFQAVAADGLNWMTRPGILFIAALIVLSFAWPWLKKRRANLAAMQLDESQSAAVPPTTGSVGLAVFLALVFGYMLWESFGFPAQSRAIPWTIAIPGLALALAQIAIEARELRSERGAQRTRAFLTGAVRSIWAVILTFFTAVWLLGFTLAMPICALAYLRVVGRERWALALAITAAGFAVFNLLFGCLLHLPFPDGALWVWTDQLFGSNLAGTLKSAFNTMCP